jgi:hypothetical protein
MPQYLKDFGERLCELGYHVLPVRPGTKGVTEKNWPNTYADAQQIRKWYTNGHAPSGVSINAKYCPLIDVDVLDEEVAQAMSDAIDRIFAGEPNLMTRTGLAPKFGVPMQSDGSIRKISSAVYTDGTHDHKVEILGDGQQWVAYHEHPDTRRPYEWWDGIDGSGIISHRRTQLPLLTADDARAVVEAFELLAAARVQAGAWRKKSGDVVERREHVAHEKDPFRDQPLGRSATEVASLLKQLPNDDLDYQDWLDALCGVHHELQDEGREIAYAWSITSAKHSDEKFDKTWDSLGRYKGAPITLRSVIFRVNQKKKAAEQKERAAGFVFHPGASYSKDFIGGPEVVEDVLPACGTGMFYGPSGGGKTFWILDLAFHVQNGVQWRDKDVAQGDVMYIAAEAGRGIKKRIRGVLNAHPDWQAPFFADMAPDLSSLEWIETIRDAATKAGKPSIIIIDTMSASFAGDDSSQADVAPMVRNLTFLSQALNCFVLFVHHTTKEGSSWRGSGAFFADVDAVLELVQEENGRQHVVQRKHRDGEMGKKYPFKLRVTEPLGLKANGKEITTCLIEQEDREASPRAEKTAGGTATFDVSEKYAKARHFLRIIEDIVGLDDTNVDESDVIVAIQADKDVNPLCEPDHPKVSNIKRTLLTLAEKGKIRREGRWIRLCR